MVSKQKTPHPNQLIMNSHYPSWAILLVTISILLATVSAQEQKNTTQTDTDTKVTYLQREEKAAIFAAFFGLITAVVGFGIYFYEMNIRQYTDRYQFMNRTGSQKDQSISSWAR